MVHKKYTYKNGKKFGPYYYETKRINGKVVTTYLGSKPPSKKRNFSGIIYPSVGLALILVLLLLFFTFSGGLTGRATLDIDANYNPGETITGKLNLDLKKGEFIPADSKIIVSLGDVSKEFYLSELVNEETGTGDYYAENTGISGNGLGYGIMGEKEVFPEIEFELRVFDSGSTDEGIDSGSDEVSDENSGKDDITGDDSGSNGETDTIGDDTIDKGDNLGDDSGSTDGEGDAGSNEVIDEGSSGGDTGSDSGDSGSLDSGSSDSTEGDSGSSDSGSDNTGDDSGSSDAGTEGGGAGITGGAISEGSFIVSGNVVNGEDFEYNIENGKSVEIVSGSVKINGESVENSIIKLKAGKEKALVSTSYSIKEEGFGEEYLGKKGLQLKIDIGELGFVAKDSSTFKIKLSYNDEGIVEAENDISVDGALEENESELGESVGGGIFNDTVINNTFVNETVFNDTIVNESVVEIVVNETIGNFSIETVQYGAVLGKPVKWTKNISVGASRQASLSVEIPLDAENISIKKVAEEKEDIEGPETEEVSEELTEEDIEAENGVKDELQENISEIAEEVKVDIDGSIITGKVSADIELEDDFTIIRWLKSFLKFTGFIVKVDATTQEIVIDINETDKSVEIEYETPAPYAIEEEIDNGKRVQIIGPEDIHYENVLAFTEINESLNVKSKEKLRIYWNENLTYLNVENAVDIDGNGFIDYIEWIVPHLSNQTFDIIVITKAEHLDSNRTFISDIYESVKELDGNWSESIGDGDYVRVTFEQNLTSEKDITIYPRTINGTPRIEVYELNKTEVITTFENISNEEYNKVYLTNFNGSQDTFDMLIINGVVEFDHIIDPQINVSGTSGIGTNVTFETGFSHLGISDENLTFYVPFDNSNDSVTAYDYHNDSHDGVFVNSAAYTSEGLIGSAANFLRVNDNRVQFMPGDYLNISFRNTTISFWLKTNYTSIEGLASTPDGSGTASGWVLGNSNGNTIGLRIQGGVSGTQQTLSTTSLTDDVWHHIVVIIDDIDISSPTAYAVIDNVVNAKKFYGAQTSHNYYNSINSLFIGDWSSWGFANATIDEFMIFDKGLSVAEITAIYNNQSARFYPKGEQIFNGLNVSGDGTENRVNITINQSLLFGSVNFSAQIGDSGSGSYTYGSETQIDTSTGTATDFTTSTPNNISVRLIYNSDSNRFYTPLLIGNVTIDSWTEGVADAIPPEVTINFPENKIYGSFDLPLNFNVSLNEEGSVMYSLDGGVNNKTMFNETAGTIGRFFNATNNSIAEGSYTFRVYANDTAGNRNYTEMVTFSYDDFVLNTCANITTANSVYILQSNISSSETCFIISANNVTLDLNGFVVDSTSTSSAVRGIDLGDFNDTNVMNGTLTDFATQVYINEGDGARFSNMKFSGSFVGLGFGSVFYGIRIISDARNIIIENTTFGPMDSSGLLSYTEGIYVQGGQNMTLRNNTFTLLSGTSASTALHLITGVSDGSIDTVRSENNLFVDLNSKGVYIEGGKLISMYDEMQNTTSPIFISSGIGNQFNHTIINASDAPVSSGVIALVGTGADETIFSNVTVTETASGDYDFYIVDGADNNMLIDSILGRYSIGSLTGAYFIYGEDQNGQIRFLSTMVATGENITYDFQLANDFAFVNSTNSAINLSANITFFGMPGNFTNPIIARGGIECTDCYNFTSLNAANVIFNVSSWSNYSIISNPDVVSPLVTINFPANTTYFTNDLPLNFNVSLNEEGSVMYSLDGGVNNKTMFNETAGIIGRFFNATNNSIAESSYTFRVYANDTAGNRNDTEMVTFYFESTNVDSCRVLDQQGRVYTLISNLSTSGTCLNVTANDVIIEGAGYFVNGTDSVDNYGVYAKGVKNLTINNMTLQDFYHAVFFEYGVNETLIENVTIINGVNNGIYIYDSNETTIRANNISNNIGEGILTSVNETKISGSILDNSFNNNGVTISLISFIGNVANNTIVGATGNGITSTTAAGLSSDVYILNNVILRTLDTGIRCSSSAGSNCYIKDNVVAYIQGNVGINIGPGMQVIGNTIHNNSDRGITLIPQSGTTGYEISGNNFFNNTQGIRGTSQSTGDLTYIRASNNTFNQVDYVVYLNGSNGVNQNHIFTNNTINGSRLDSFYLIGNNLDNLTFINNTITNPNISSFDLNVVSQGIDNLTFVNTFLKNYTFGGTGSSGVIFEDTLNGKVSFLGAISGNGTNLTNDLKLSNNFIEVKAEENPGLNVSANVSFYAMPGDFIRPEIYHSGVLCGDCYNFTSLNSVIVEFNVTSFSNYSIKEDTNINSCRVLDIPGKEYTLISNLSTSGICLNVTANNIIIEGAGYFVNGTDSVDNYGVYAKGVKNLTINNLTLQDFYHGVLFEYGVNETLIENVTIINGVNNGIYIYDSNETTIRANNISNNGLNGISLNINTTGISGLITQNVLNDNNGNAIGLLSFIGNVANNTIVNATGLGITSTTSGAIESNVSILDNVVLRTLDTGIRCSLSAGSNCYIKDNVVAYIQGNVGINIGPGMQVIGNTIHNNSDRGIALIAQDGTVSYEISRNNFFNNTYGIRGTSQTTADLTYINVFNNVFNQVDYAIHLTGSNGLNQNHVFTNNTINGSRLDSFYLTGTNLDNLTFINNTVSNPNTSSFDINVVSQGIDNLTFVNTFLKNYTFGGTGSSGVIFEDTLNGKVSFLGAISGNGTNLTNDLKLSNNLIDVNSETNLGLNVSANVSLYNLQNSFARPSVFRDDVLCGDCYNFTPLTAGTVEFNVTGFTNYSIQNNNDVFDSILEINSTDNTNLTSVDLNCYTTLSDEEGDNMNVSVWWFNSSLEAFRFDFNESYASNTLFITSLDSANTTKGDAWSCGIKTYDGFDFSNQINSTSLTILNSPPGAPVLDSPNDGSSTTDRTPQFSWTSGGDDDLDSLTYELNLTCFNVAGGGCTSKGSDNRHVTSISGTTYTIIGDLKYLYDSNYFYNWSVRANDSEDFSLWSSSRGINISALIEISLPNSSVEFGQINFQGSNDTTDDSPSPFVIQNDGNSFVNVTVEATSLWNTVVNPTEYYEFKADNVSSESGAFNWLGSITAFTSVPLTGSAQLFLAELNYTNVTDSAEIDISIAVPPNEGSDVRSSVVTFTANLGE